jgi:hypothetical protein
MILNSAGYGRVECVSEANTKTTRTTAHSGRGCSFSNRKLLAPNQKLGSHPGCVCFWMQHALGMVQGFDNGRHREVPMTKKRTLLLAGWPLVYAAMDKNGISKYLGQLRFICMFVPDLQMAEKAAIRAPTRKHMKDSLWPRGLVIVMETYQLINPSVSLALCRHA